MKYKIEYTFCHRKPERSFFYKGKQFPVCARCTGIYAAYITIPIFIFYYLPIIYILLLFLPCMVDGLIQGFTKWESNNILRVITGFMSGIGIVGIASLIGKKIGIIILEIIN